MTLTVFLRGLALGVALPLALVATALPASAQKKPVLIWHTEFDPGAAKVMERMVAEFHQKHPQWEAQVEQIAFGSLVTKLMAGIAAKSPPDMVHIYPPMLASLVDKNLIVSVDDVVKAIGEPDIYPNVKQLGSINNRYYGISYAFGVTGLGYRADVFRAKGVTPPRTWAEFEKAAQAVHEPDRGMSAVLLPGEPLFIADIATVLLANNGGGFIDSKTFRPRFLEKANLEMLEFYKVLDRYAQKGWRSHKYLDTYNGFARGDGAMHPQAYARHTSYVERYAKPELRTADAFGVVTFPRGPSAGTREGSGSYDGELWVIFKDAANSEGAKAFLKVFYDPKFYRDYTLTVPIHLTPIFKSVAEDPSYQAAPFIQKYRPWLTYAVDLASGSRAFPLLTSSMDDRLVPFWFELLGSNIISDMVLDVLDGKPAQEAARRAQSRTEDLITKLGYKRW
ncbi:MAG: ABC transporter substrate-binding protein [Candidatus Rokuibacteriota bacterium]